MTKKTFRTLFIIALIGALFPMFRDWTGIAPYFPSIIILIIVFIAKYLKLLFNKAIIYFFLLFIYIFLLHRNLLDINLILIIFLPYFFVYIFLYHYCKEKDIDTLKWIAILGLIILTIRSITGIYIESIFPGAARSMNAELPQDLLAKYKQLGVGSYGISTGLIFIYPVMVGIFKIQKNKPKKILIVLFILLTTYFTYKAAFVTSLFFSIVAIIISFFLGKNLIKNIFIITIALLMILLLGFSNITDLIIVKSKVSFTENAILMEKISEIENAKIYGETEGDLNNRKYLYSKSWDAFSNNPIFGSGEILSIGGHATWIDWLGLYGIVGLILLFLLMRELYKKLIVLISQSSLKFYYLLGFLLFIPLGIIKNCSGTEVTYLLFIISPSLIFLVNTPKYNITQKKRL